MSKDTRLPWRDMLVLRGAVRAARRCLPSGAAQAHRYTEWWMARDHVWLPAASMACKAPARPKGSAGEMGSSRAGAVAEAAQLR